MKRILFILLLLLPMVAFSQNSKKVKALQKQKVELQNTLKKSKAELWVLPADSREEAEPPKSFWTESPACFIHRGM